MSTVTKKDLVDRVAARTGHKRAAVKECVQAMLDEIVATLGDADRLELRDFGVFEVRQRKARMAQNPKTLVPVEVPAKNSVKFKPGRLMQRAVDDAPVAAMEAKPESAGVLQAAHSA